MFAATELNGQMAQRGRGSHLGKKIDKAFASTIVLDVPHDIFGRKMFNSLVKIVFLLVLSGCVVPGCAQLKETGRIIGHTTRDATTAIGHGTRDAAKAVGEGVKKVFKSAPENE
jgi:hypothetical protein